MPRTGTCIGRDHAGYRFPMAVAEWTYEVAPAGAPAGGLDEYVVVGPSGEALGKVVTLLGRGEELWLVVEPASPPFRHSPRAIPWDQVRDVDHEALTVVLSLGEDGLGSALELDPSKGVEPADEGHTDADAIRVVELPPELRPAAGRPGNVAGTADRPTYAASLIVGGIGIFTLLVVVVILTLTESEWAIALFALPALLLAAAGFLGYRAWRFPYEQA